MSRATDLVDEWQARVALYERARRPLLVVWVMILLAQAAVFARYVHGREILLGALWVVQLYFCMIVISYFDRRIILRFLRCPQCNGVPFIQEGVGWNNSLAAANGAFYIMRFFPTARRCLHCRAQLKPPKMSGLARDLAKRLARHAPADETEAKHLESMRVLACREVESFGRRHFDPGHFTVSCFIVHPDTGRLLLHHHKRLGRWLPMGGHIDVGESPPAAALREGEEESGLRDLELVTADILTVDVHPIPAGKGEPEHHHFDVGYLARTPRPDAIRKNPEESNELEWVSLDEALTRMNGDAAAARAIARIRQAFARASNILTLEGRSIEGA